MVPFKGRDTGRQCLRLSRPGLMRTIRRSHQRRDGGGAKPRRELSDLQPSASRSKKARLGVLLQPGVECT